LRAGESQLTRVRAAVLEAFNEPLAIRSYPHPDDPAAGEALIHVDIAGSAEPMCTCGWASLLSLCEHHGARIAGRIEKLGAGLDRDWLGEPLREGDRVTWASSISCGECFYCRVKGQPTRCLTRKAYGISYRASDAPHLRGGYAEKILLRAGTAIFRIPDAVPSEALSEPAAR